MRVGRATGGASFFQAKERQAMRTKGIKLLLTILAITCAQSAAAQAKKPNIVILATGGTIAGAAASGTQAAYTSGAVTIDATLAAVSFDQTGTTRIGMYLLNHSFMLPGLVTTSRRSVSRSF